MSELSGIELREAVAVKVMGLEQAQRGRLRVTEANNDFYVDQLVAHPQGDMLIYYATATVAQWQTVPHYESDIAAAWLVVERMQEWCVKNGKTHWLDDYGRTELSHMKAARAAEYICRAALKATDS